MAENQEDRSREDLTEEPSQYRIEEYRRKGQVAQSRELTGLFALLAAATAAYALAPRSGWQLADFMREVFRSDFSAHLDLSSGQVLGHLMGKALSIAARVGLPICLAGFVVGIAGSLTQIGVIVSVEPISPDLTKLDPIQGFRRIFSIRQGIDAIRTVLKLIAVVAVGYFLIRSEVLRSPVYLENDIWILGPAYGYSAKTVFYALMAVLVAFGALDYWLQRLEYSKSIRMTKQEAKQEHKEREGDPQIKARIRSIQREMARRRMMQAVKKADVVVTNPTHIAVALVYDKDKMAAPKVVAKGADLIAQKIKKIASEAGVPLVENVPLARTLYKSVKVGQGIPRALYQAVAEVLAYVYRLKRKGP